MITLITGGNTGIGLAIVKALLMAPMTGEQVILITSRRLERSAAAVKGLERDPTFSKSMEAGHRIIPLQLDVDNDSSVQALVEQISRDYGKLDVLVNNAGM